jgi:hypothetical protein
MNYLTTADIAARYGKDYRTATRWCQRRLFPNLIKGRRTASGAIYLIPESDLEGFTPPRRGRPAAAKPTRLTTAQRRSRQRKAARATKTDT